MKNFKKNIALLAALACAGTMLAGCNSERTPDTPANDGNDTPAANNSNDTPSDSGNDAPAASGDAYADAQSAGTGTLVLPEGEGKVLNIYCWNGDFRKYVEAYYKAPEGVTFNWIEVANEGGAYQTALDQALMNQESASADDKVDIFLAEADYILK